MIWMLVDIVKYCIVVVGCWVFIFKVELVIDIILVRDEWIVFEEIERFKLVGWDLEVVLIFVVVIISIV